MKNLDEVIIQNPEPYNSIYAFLKSKVIPKYPCLTYCYQDNFDEEGNPRIQYYIRYAADLSLKQDDKLYLCILQDIWDFCELCGIPYDEELNVDFILLWMVILLKNNVNDFKDIKPTDFIDFACELEEIGKDLKSYESAVNRTFIQEYIMPFFFF